MNRNVKILLAIVVVVLILGIVINPIFPMGFGFILLFALWNSMGGYAGAAGNPYRKRMIQGRGIRGYTHTRQYYKPVEEKETERGVEFKTTVFVFFLGISLIIIGFILILL